MKKKHVCKDCKRGDPEVTFYRRGNGLRFVCKECDKERRARYSYSRASMERRNQHKTLRESAERKNPELTAKFILLDSRKSDKGKGMVNDLTIEFIQALTANGCGYCGDRSSRIALDRIDNSIGHAQLNVNPCCRRCNLLRRDMPYAAWVELVPMVRSITQRGLFGSWNSGPLKSFKNALVAQLD